MWHFEFPSQLTSALSYPAPKLGFHLLHSICLIFHCFGTIQFRTFLAGSTLSTIHRARRIISCRFRPSLDYFPGSETHPLIMVFYQWKFLLDFEPGAHNFYQNCALSWDCGGFRWNSVDPLLGIGALFVTQLTKFVCKSRPNSTFNRSFGHTSRRICWILPNTAGCIYQWQLLRRWTCSDLY